MGKRILVVDDAKFMRTIIKRTLARSGFEICGEAADGTEAIHQFERLRPDLVTMDVTMKEKNGVDAARTILARHPEARIVMLTALGDKKLLIDCVAVGVKDFVVKPFAAKRILSAVRKALA